MNHDFSLRFCGLFYFALSMIFEHIRLFWPDNGRRLGFFPVLEFPPSFNRSIFVNDIVIKAGFMVFLSTRG